MGVGHKARYSPGDTVSFIAKNEHAVVLRLVGVLERPRGLGFWYVRLPDGNVMSAGAKGMRIVKWKENS